MNNNLGSKRKIMLLHQHCIVDSESVDLSIAYRSPHGDTVTTFTALVAYRFVANEVEYRLVKASAKTILNSNGNIIQETDYSHYPVDVLQNADGVAIPLAFGWLFRSLKGIPFSAITRDL